MKKRILFLAIIFFAGEAKTQTNYMLPDSNAVWIFHYWKYASGPPSSSSEVGFSCIKIEGDTIINTNLYHKLYAYPWCGINIKSYMGAFRNDRSAGKTYIVLPNLMVEKLFYDFNIQYNDSLKYKTIFSICSLNGNNGEWACNTNPSNAVFNKIDSVMFIDGIWHKRYSVNSADPCLDKNDDMIDGIGWSTVFTIGSMYRRPCRLHCFFENNQLKYEFNPSYSIAPCSDLIYLLKVNELNENNKIAVYPNPCSQNVITIRGINADKVKIINLLGEKYDLDIQNNQVFVEDIPDGLYVIQIQDIFTKKYYYIKWLKY